MDIKFRSHILNSGTTFRSCIPARYKIQDGLEAPVTWQFCFPSLFFARFLCVCVCVLCVGHSVTVRLYNPMDCSPPGSSVHGVLQTRILVWVAISFSRGIFPTQEWNLGFLHCRQILWPSEPSGKPLLHICIHYICILGCLHWSVKIARKQFAVNISWISEVEI